MDGTVTFPRLFVKLVQEGRCVFFTFCLINQTKLKNVEHFLYFTSLNEQYAFFLWKGCLNVISQPQELEKQCHTIFSQQCYLFKPVWWRITMIQFRTQAAVLMKKRS